MKKREEIDYLQKKINHVMNEKEQATRGKNMPSLYLPIIDFAIDLCAGLVISLIIGYALKKIFNSGPLILIICVPFGLICGYYNVYKRNMVKRDKI